MTVSRAERDRRMASMVDALRASGLRITHQRLEVARAIARADIHPDVESVYREVRKRVPTIALDTVYRTLGALEEKGAVVRVSTTSGPVRYDANLTRHHHFVCTKCGVVHDIMDAALDAVRPAPGAVRHCTVESVEVQLRGLCAACAENTIDQRRGATV